MMWHAHAPWWLPGTFTLAGFFLGYWWGRREVLRRVKQELRKISIDDVAKQEARKAKKDEG